MATNLTLDKVLKEGTARQKALLVCMDYKLETSKGFKPLVTTSEEKAIRDSLKDGEERKQFNRWVSIYNAYTQYATSIIVSYASMYKQYGYKLLVLIREREGLYAEETHLNGLLANIREKQGEEASELFIDLCEKIPLKYGYFRRTYDGFIEYKTDIDNTLIENINEELDNLTLSLKMLKGACEAVKTFTKNHKSKEFMNEYLLEYLEDAKIDFALEHSPKYSKQALSEYKLEEHAIYLSSEVKLLFPDYNEIPYEDYKEVYEAILAHMEDYLK